MEKKTVIDIEVIRHSLSHVLAAAVLEMFPETKLGIGPAIENGFYYDFELPRTLIPEDLPILEQKMRKLIKDNLSFEKVEISADEAIKALKKSDQKYKLELVNDLKDLGEQKVSLYKTGEFVDLCKGPHVGSTADLTTVAFKLDKIAGAYWKGSEKNQMLQRIYALAFESKKELDEYLEMLEQAKKRDHKKLGRELELFVFDDSAPGMPYWLPKGLTLYNILIDFWRQEHKQRGYQEIKSPLINKKSLYQTSGHWDHYRSEMFLSETKENETYGLKPMNCPNAMVVYGLKPRSYRDLPLRLSDCDTLHRYELSGVLNGLFRARSFSQDDAHIFVTEEQIETEVKDIFEIVEKFYKKFDLEYSFRLGTRPQEFMGDEKTWNHAEDVLKSILDKSKKKFIVLDGDGAFYGPKIDILMKDSLGREWQMGTIQLDFQLPQNFKLTYADQDGTDKVPVTIHRVIYGSLERFIGILTEHYAGAFPVWLAPIQAVVMPISEKQIDYAKEVKKKLEDAQIRVELDDRNESIGKKIREGQMQKTPYMLIVGEKEVMGGVVAVREAVRGDLGQSSIEDLIEKIKKA